MSPPRKHEIPSKPVGRRKDKDIVKMKQSLECLLTLLPLLFVFSLLLVVVYHTGYKTALRGRTANSQLGHLQETAQYINSRYGFVNIQFLSKDYVEMTKSWICNVRLHGPSVLERTIFIATDAEAFDGIRSFSSDLNVVLKVYSEKKDEYIYGEQDYFRLMLWRTSIVDKLLSKRVNLMLTESDAIWFQNPFELLNLDKMEEDIVFMDDNPPFKIPNGGFIYIRYSDQTRSAWRNVLRRQQKTVHNEQVLIKAVYEHYQSLNRLKIRWLSQEEFASGTWYDSHAPDESRDPNLVVLLFNWLKGIGPKIERAKKYRQWFLDDDGQCLNDVLSLQQ